MTEDKKDESNFYSGRLAGFNEGKKGALGPRPIKSFDQTAYGIAMKYGQKTSDSDIDLDGDNF